MTPYVPTISSNRKPSIFGAKQQPFDSIAQQFLFRPPSITDIVLNIDLAPTFLDMAGLRPPAHMDGQSFLPVLEAAHAWSRDSASHEDPPPPEELDVPPGLVAGWRHSFLIERG